MYATEMIPLGRNGTERLRNEEIKILRKMLEEKSDESRNISDTGFCIFLKIQGGQIRLLRMTSTPDKMR